MLSTLRNAWKVADLRKRLLFTLMMIIVFRFGNFVTVPGVDPAAVAKMTQSSSGTGNLLAFYDLLSGGAFSRFSVLAMGVVPYINASIIMQLLTIAVPYLEQLSKEGEDGRKKIQKMTRYSAVALGLLQAIGTYAIIRSSGAIADTSKITMFIIILSLTTGTIFVMWLGERITVKGVGNGVSLLIFVNIISKLSSTAFQIMGLQKAETVNFVEVIIFVVVSIGLFIAVIMMSLAERRIPVQYAGKTAGNRTFKGQTTHIPIGLNSASVIGIIFAMSVMQFPATIAQFAPTSAFGKFITSSPYSVFKSNTISYAVVYFIMVLFFTWFYTQVTFKPDEMAENMHKSSGFVPGIRPGEPTARFIERVLNKVSLIGGTFAGLVAIFPIVLQGYTSFKGIQFGGTSLLIVVGVALDTLRQLESQLVMRHYQGFLK